VPSLLAQVPYCYYYARDVWEAASDAVNRVCCYLAYNHCTRSDESRMLSVDEVPQWRFEGKLPRTHTKVGDGAIVPDNNTPANELLLSLYLWLASLQHAYPKLAATIVRYTILYLCLVSVVLAMCSWRNASGYELPDHIKP
jgi:hypothetical protein